VTGEKMTKKDKKIIKKQYKQGFIKTLKLMAKSIGRPQYKFYIYFGVPGSGKTTFAAWIAKKILKNGGRVWSNVPIKHTMKLNPKEDIGTSLIQDGHIIIDEAGVEYNNRDFKEFSKKATHFYKHHRHYRTTIHLFSQGFDDMDKKLRTLATSLFVVKKSLIPFFIRRHQISKKVGINELTKDICDEYYKVPFSSKYIFCPVLWEMFDTYSIEELPEKEWDTWQQQEVYV